MLSLIATNLLGQHTMELSLHRAEQGAAASVADAALASEDLSPDLGWALPLLIDGLAFGVVITEPDGAVSLLNQAAREAFARTRLARVQGGMLQAAQPQHARLLQAALSKASRGMRSVLTLQGAGTPALTLALLPLQQRQASRSARVAVLMQRPSVCETLMLCFFARRHGLTATEEQVLGVLCEGYSAPHIALQMNVAVSTVRSHVRSLCAKTESRGGRELIRRVATLPPVMPALRHETLH